MTMVDPSPAFCRPSAPPCRLLIWERSGIWTAGLRAALGRGAQPVEIRFREELEDELAQSPCSFAVVEITAENVPSMAAWLPNLRSRWPQSVVIAAAERGLDACEPLIREAGAEAWVDSPSRVDGVARMFRRHLLRHPAPLPDLRTAWRERLPW